MNACLRLLALGAVASGLVVASAQPVSAQNACAGLPTHGELKAALSRAATDVTGPNRGFGLPMWGTVVNRDGTVCAVVFTGANLGDQWPGSRVISAQKANTANAFSLNNLALSTAQLYPLVQPGASLFGLQESNPVDTRVAYQGSSSNFGRPNDPMVQDRIGGVNVFGGGLALYRNGQIVGAVGVSGDTSCADHNIAWQTRRLLGLNITPSNDNITYGPGGHPNCVGGETPPAP
jgi:uncharacterized protein GlcG (DUF336 family)